MAEQEQIITQLFQAMNEKDTEIHKLKEFSEQVVTLGEELKIKKFMIEQEKDDEICTLRNQLQQCHIDLEFLKTENLHLNQTLSNINSPNISFHSPVVSGVGCPQARAKCVSNMRRAGDTLDEQIQRIPQLKREKVKREKNDMKLKNAEFAANIETWRERMSQGGKKKSIKNKLNKKRIKKSIKN